MDVCEKCGAKRTVRMRYYREGRCSECGHFLEAHAMLCDKCETERIRTEMRLERKET